MQKNIFSNRLLLFMLCVLALACNKNSVEPLDPEMDFKLRLLNEKGEESTSFKEGERFSMSFLITSKIDETRFFYLHGVTNNRGLFRIIRTQDSLDLGQPYEPISCTGQKESIKGKATLEIKIPWNSDSVPTYAYCVQSIPKQLLGKGQYKTSFEGFLSVGSLESSRPTKKLSLSVNFDIR
jgi:hypothetical protein